MVCDNLIVEPDLFVVCDPDKLDNYGCKGAPDLVIEILSPCTRRHDRVVKLDLYQRAGAWSIGWSIRRTKQCRSCS